MSNLLSAGPARVVGTWGGNGQRGANMDNDLLLLRPENLEGHRQGPRIAGGWRVGRVRVGGSCSRMWLYSVSLFVN